MPALYDIDEYNQTKNSNYTEFNEIQINQFDEGLKIKNIIVIYDNKDFENSIKSLELNYEIKFIKKEDIENLLLVEEKDKKYEMRIMKYYIITDIKTANELYNTFNFYIYNYGYSLIFVLLCHSNSLISKTFLSGTKLSCICLYSYESIKEYFNYIKNVYKNPYSINSKELFINENNKPNNQLFQQLKNTDEKDNGWDIIKEINPCIFISNYINRDSNITILSNFIIGMYELYKEKDGLELYFKKYSKYLGIISCLEEQLNSFSLLKQVIYVYTREEQKNKAGQPLSFYSLINNDLRSGELKKIERYIPLIYIIKDAIFMKTISSYDKIIYRGTFLKLDFIKKLKTKTKIFSPCFWSCSKDKTVALKFIKAYKKNTLLIILGNKNNNIDIDIENLSSFPEEKEALVIPFCAFEVKSIKFVKKPLQFYEITLEYIEVRFQNDKIVNLPIVESKNDNI